LLTLAQQHCSSRSSTVAIATATANRSFVPARGRFIGCCGHTAAATTSTTGQALLVHGIEALAFLEVGFAGRGQLFLVQLLCCGFGRTRVRVG
jgi:hypothetical protein